MGSITLLGVYYIVWINCHVASSALFTIEYEDNVLPNGRCVCGYLCWTLSLERHGHYIGAHTLPMTRRAAPTCRGYHLAPEIYSHSPVTAQMNVIYEAFQ